VADNHASIYPFERLRLDDPAHPLEPEATLTQAMAGQRTSRSRLMACA